ncbi:glycoside hydrolase family protein [Enterobacter hormaechei]|uniref:glycoside hydrolase family protein n=1 Tax=Enterobacter hormaechei TaxID=158836 RepID=UPI00286153EE|nr:glycoside hydrolase family protein [Enterobacter hormaechei]ELD3314784.1 glycoside hydrolase family protein [Enterobacter hormaechei]ELD3470507.1 glycoside hydrolase family protein [Enterobacter hormaechei]MDR9954980.1 glycoside hydrolase family protein [Enterobacter hormaechei subsp. xiangfangensis]MDS0073210.1 glycoside hydrolase family protein [Enterobacter hormaechei subsp. xiangfangensis]HBL8991149.1 glycoside hydrolase family protein [Enterobacter hormaechei]
MKICYPIRNTSGQEFRSPDEVMRLVDGEAHGTWLLGTNGLWHGGIHISDVSSPFSALNPDALNTGEPEPIRFMADGTVVAYRLNKEYLTAPYCGQQLRYSSCFVLVKSLCRPDPQKEKSWLEFYSLYMHLAPVSDYPASPCYKVRDGHSGILLRQYKNGQNGLPEGAPDNGEAGTYPAPAKANKSLKAGDRFVSSRTGRFYVTRNGQTTLTTFGLVRLLKDNVPGKEQYWVTLDPALMEPAGEIQGLMPAWMQRAKQKGAFDSVELTGGTEEWQVSAGAPVGFMGCTESPAEGNKPVDKEWFIHLEVLSTDTRMPGFLANLEGVRGEKRSVLVPKGKNLFIRQDAAGQPVFTPTSARLGAQCLLTRDAATPVADGSRNWWYKVTGSGWLPQSDVEDVNQYDLLKLGFQALEEESGGDVMDSPYEGWVPQAFNAVSRSAEQGADYQYSQVPPFYRGLMAEMDSNHDGKLTAEEIRQALAVRDPLVKNVVNRLVVKHHSEWSKGRSTGRWEGFYQDLDPLAVKYCEKWQADLEWMSRVPPFDKDEAVWHFHPVVFLDAIGQKRNKEIIFPFKVKPKNDIEGVWKRYYWAASLTDSNASQAIFGRNRSRGNRKHAARDLYSEPLTEIVAVSNGIVRSISHYYFGTWQITIEHTTNDGRHFYIRYGEVDPQSIVFGNGEKVQQGTVIAKTGLMIDPSTRRHPNIIPGQVVYMLHFEYYPGNETLPPPNNTPTPPFQRRNDLQDPIDILREGYNNTFCNENNDTESRSAISELTVSDMGKAFIKEWESFRSTAYNDSEGFCSIGYGHLIARARCEDISLPEEFRNGITNSKADELFESRLSNYIKELKASVSTDLYQYEFDALISLLFNMGRMSKAPQLTLKLNQANYEGAANEFLDITNGGVSGLVTRRQKERNLFLTGAYDFSR